MYMYVERERNGYAQGRCIYLFIDIGEKRNERVLATVAKVRRRRREAGRECDIAHERWRRPSKALIC